jgi:drug/metabolite transporter (DMT)-like permease
VLAILGGLGAAFLWATANLISSRSSRLIGAASTLGWMLFVGLVMATPFALASGPLPALTPILAVWLAGSGFGGTIGLMFLYRGLKIGKVGVVTALASTEGAMAALIAVAAGERMTPVVALMLCVITAGVATVTLTASGATATATTPADAGAAVSPQASPHRFTAETRAALYGAAAALCFGFGIYATGQLGAALPPFVAILPVRVVGTVFVLVPLAITGRLRMTRAAAPMVIAIGTAELFGNVVYVIGAKESIAIAAVLASQYGAVAAVAAFFLFRERLSMPQRSGVVAIALGVAVLTAVRG